MAEMPANRAPAGSAAPPPVHHEGPGRRGFPAPRDLAAPRNLPAHRRPNPAGAWAVYLIVLAGVAVGLYIAWQGSKDAARGADLVGGSLLVAALARLVLPPRYAGPLSSRGKTSDVLAFAAFGAGVLGVALMLP